MTGLQILVNTILMNVHFSTEKFVNHFDHVNTSFVMKVLVAVTASDSGISFDFETEFPCIIAEIQVLGKNGVIVIGHILEPWKRHVEK